MFLSGYKTYLTSLAICFLAGAKALGWISPELYEALLTLLGAFGLAALRAGVKKV